MNAEGENPAAPSCAPSTTPSAAGATAVASAAEPGHVPGQLPAPYRYLLFTGRLLRGFLEQGLPGATAGVMRFLTFRGFATSPSQPPVVITYLQYHTPASARQQHLPVRALRGEAMFITPLQVLQQQVPVIVAGSNNHSQPSKGYHTPLLSHPLDTTPPSGVRE